MLEKDHEKAIVARSHKAVIIYTQRYFLFFILFSRFLFNLKQFSSAKMFCSHCNIFCSIWNMFANIFCSFCNIFYSLCIKSYSRTFFATFVTFFELDSTLRRTRITTTKLLLGSLRIARGKKILLQRQKKTILYIKFFNLFLGV